MPQASYSFIDVAILDEVRERFAAGDALVVLSRDLDTVLWANGAGARLFGHDDIEAIIGEPSNLGFAARRQITATRGYPRIGRDRSLMVRLASGMTSAAVAFVASGIALPDGEDAILLAIPATAGSTDAAAKALGGFNEPGHFVAFVDGDGTIEAASDGFDALGVSAETLAGLVAEVRSERDRIVKRVIPGKAGALPAGLARLTDNPVRHFLVVIDEGRAGDDPVPADLTAAEPEAQPVDDPVVTAGVEPMPAALEPFEQAAAEMFAQDNAAPTVAQEAPPAEPEAAPPHHDNWYFSAADDTPDPVGSVETPAAPPPAPFEIDPTAAPTRFVWRTDAEGNFSTVSPEFARAVGILAADIVGRRFKDVANTFGLDPHGDIAGLLDRRDTWSGRSVLWPVAGTDLKVPVDLAALPVYGRDRNFEGFRGFGVARTADAVVDPEGLGLVLVTGGSAPESPAAKADEEAPTEATEHSADPFQGEVPALTIVPKPDRRFSDKVIRLAEHRPVPPEKSLSNFERSAFREIGERLRKDGEAAVTALTAGTTQPKPERGETEAEKTPPAEDAVQASAEEPQFDFPETPQEVIAEEDFPLPADIADSLRPEEPAEPSAQDQPELENVVETPQPVKELVADHIQPVAQDPEPQVEPEPDLPAPEPALEKHGDPEDLEDEPVRRPTDTSILSRLPVPVLIHSGDALHYANEEFLGLTGYPSLEALAEAGGLDALFSDPYRDEPASDGPDRTLRLRTGLGEEFPIDALLRSVPWNGGKALMLVVRRTGEEEPQPEPTFTRSPDEQELKNRVAEMRTIIDTATDGVVLIANDGTIRSISRPAEALFGFESDDVTGKPFASLFAIESQRAARDYLNGLSDHGVASVLNDGREVIGREAQGRFIPLFMTIGKLPGESGFCAVVRDITQWKRAEEDLTQARAMAERASSQKSDFLARVSHEIRTPLNAIIGFSELMVDERFGPIANDRYRDYLRDINRSGNHVLDLVNDLLDISKIEAGQQDMAYEAVSLNDTLAETVAMMQPQANRERVIIRSSFASKLPDVVADLRSVRQIALNILSNAVRYTQAGGQVIISTSYEPSGDVVMRVRDTGIGMSQAEIEQALKPFKQINSLKRARGDGTGLGLPLTKAMVEANRARFSINSTPGEGTLVEIAFPSPRVLAD